jgi:hypothetical protein
MQQHHTGEQLPNGAFVTSVVFSRHADGTTVEEMHDSHGGRTVTPIPPEGSIASNQAKLGQRLRDALVSNASFLSGGVSDHDQVMALTREIDALIRVVISRFETTVGT